jgi:nucleoside-diphosphate-sugar epimerase
VGSHVLDRLHERQIPTAILCRSKSPRCFLEKHLNWAETRIGSLNDPSSLNGAMAGITHVIHCAGSTKAVGTREFYDVNQGGTRNLAESLPATVQRLVHISSLAAAGPSKPDTALSESDPSRPVSEYGRSKLAGEQEIREQCRSEYVILRPPAVYGPRDAEFLRLFRAVQRHLRPLPALQPLSLVFVVDLAETIVRCLTTENVSGKTYYVSSPEVVTARRMAEEIAALMQVWTLPFPLPTSLLWPLCLGQELISRATGKASVLGLQKYSELRAAAWVCSPARLQQDTGLECRTDLRSGLKQTILWYQENGWL